MVFYCISIPKKALKYKIPLQIMLSVMLNSTGVKAVTCVLKTTMTKMNKICRPNVLKVRLDHNMFLCFPVFEH